MVDWYSILIKYGVAIPNEEQIIIHCPFHEDRRESCSINLDKGVWICFAGCGQGGLKYFIKKYTGKSWEELNEDFQVQTYDLEFNWFDDELDDEQLDIVDTPDTVLDIEDNHWIYKRGFSYESILKWGCKTNKYDDFMIPVEDAESNIKGWITRRRSAIPKYLFTKGFSKSKVLFGINQLYNTDVLYVVEGALDCMWLNQFGYSSVAILWASVSKTQINLLSKLNPSEVVLALDNDEAGARGIEKATVDMKDRFLLSYLTLPENYKDVQEIYNPQTLRNVMLNKTIF